ncbi:MAG: glutathione S-transferase-like protein [Frankiales bacterium]|nr:glutathione S-transferase-like protein [Frankiales bacterium]
MAYVSESGSFERDTRYLNGDWGPEPGRYQLVVSRACPWASRAIVVRELLGLQEALPMLVCGPVHDEDSWTFEGGRLKDLYPDGYDRGITVPAIVDLTTGTVVNNDYPSLTLRLETEWTALHAEGAPDLYPEPLREEMDEVMELVFHDVNNGVYKCGFAGDQDAYEKAYRTLWDRLDWLTDRLSGQRFLMGDAITEADVRLFTTLVRFDAVYHSHFKCNRQKLSEMPVLWRYARDLFQTPGFGDTVDFEHIKQHYYVVQKDINPTQVVPLGPDLSGWQQPV